MLPGRAGHSSPCRARRRRFHAAVASCPTAPSIDHGNPVTRFQALRHRSRLHPHHQVRAVLLACGSRAAFRPTGSEGAQYPRRLDQCRTPASARPCRLPASSMSGRRNQPHARHRRYPDPGRAVPLAGLHRSRPSWSSSSPRIWPKPATGQPELPAIVRHLLAMQRLSSGGLRVDLGVGPGWTSRGSYDGSVGFLLDDGVS